MNESITRAAGGVNGQEMGFVEMIQLAEFLGREALHSAILYINRSVKQPNRASLLSRWRNSGSGWGICKTR